MVDQKFVCVTFIVLIVGSCVNSLPQPSSSTEPRVIALSSNSVVPPIAQLRTADSPKNSSNTTVPDLQNRSVVDVPPNCPPPKVMNSDGVCREVWKDEHDGK